MNDHKNPDLPFFPSYSLRALRVPPVSYTHLDVYKRQELRFSRAAQLWAAGGTLAGILLLQWVLLQSGQDVTLVLTLLPVTAYFPAIICLHILSSSRFFPTAAVWTLGLTACFTTDILRKLLLLLCTRFSISGAALDAIITVCMPVSYTHLDVYKRQV